MEKAGLTMPEAPTWEFIADAARKMTDRAADINGICLRGKAGWGENMAFLTAMSNSFGARWFDENWNPQFDQPEWKKTLAFLCQADDRCRPAGRLLQRLQREPGAVPAGQMRHVDRRHGGGVHRVEPEGLHRRRQGRLCAGCPTPASASAATGYGRGRWPFRPASQKADAAQKFVSWATSKGYLELVASKEGWANVPPGTRTSLYANPEYQKAAPFAKMTLATPSTRLIRRKPTRQAGALYRRAVRRHSRIPGSRHDRRPALLGSTCRPDVGRRCAEAGPGRRDQHDD